MSLVRCEVAVSLAGIFMFGQTGFCRREQVFSVVSFKGGFAEGGSHYPHLKLSEGFSYTFERRGSAPVLQTIHASITIF